MVMRFVLLVYTLARTELQKNICSSRTRYRRRKRHQATAAQKLTNRFPSADPTTLAFQIGHGSRPRNMSLSDKQTKAVIEG